MYVSVCVLMLCPYAYVYDIGMPYWILYKYTPMHGQASSHMCPQTNRRKWAYFLVYMRESSRCKVHRPSLLFFISPSLNYANIHLSILSLAVCLSFSFSFFLLLSFFSLSLSLSLSLCARIFFLISCSYACVIVKSVLNSVDSCVV